MTAQISISKDAIRSEDGILLSFIDGRRIAMEECYLAVEMSHSAALVSIQRLIQAGYLYLAVSVTPWGVEFEIQQTEKGLRQASCKTCERSE